MKFSAQEDIEAPIDEVFAFVSDFDRFERLAVRRGADVRRISAQHSAIVGAKWETVVKVRSKPRQIMVEMTEFDRPSAIKFRANSKGMKGETSIELLALSKGRTRLKISMSLAAKTLTARLLLQSLKLGQSRVRRQFQSRLSDFARDAEERYRHSM
ncbi:SRPBCC family protein [Ruegeria arenilitoris]|uniref:SRPBCC family protein n=1 Tax=Ruegeria arenilitoris TaxID=1173585 RepID=UPI00147F8FE2|nr:SRPBCC family protein [Ruegeria arenilitoris]